MITNDRQFRISKAELDKMHMSLAALESGGIKDSDEFERVLYQDALKAQISELSEEVHEYERLKVSDQTNFPFIGLDRLPEMLIQARIASGYSHQKLATLLGVREQQIQRWEASGYKSASFDNLLRVAAALDLKVSSEGIRFSGAKFLKKVSRFLSEWASESFGCNLFSPESLEAYRSSEESIRSAGLFAMVTQLSRVVGCSVSDLVGSIGSERDLSIELLAESRFKVPKNAAATKLGAHALYANYIAHLSAQAASRKKCGALIDDPVCLNRHIKENYGRFDFESVLNYCWDNGVVVVPMQESGSFHGAVWDVNGCLVITLKQRKQYSDIWMFDLLHELKHVLDHQKDGGFSYLEMHPINSERVSSEEEQGANYFAEDAIFGGQSDEIEQAVVEMAQGSVEAVKGAVIAVAERRKIPVGALANHMAHRMEEDGITNWWGTATNLQGADNEANPCRVAINRFYSEVDLSSLNPLDRDVLTRAIKLERTND